MEPRAITLLNELKLLGYEKEANLILKIRQGKLFGRFELIVQNGSLVRVEKEILYDDLAKH